MSEHQAATPADTAPSPGNPEPQMIDIGGRRLALTCSGAGSPSVILETGLGAESNEWAFVQRETSAVARVVRARVPFVHRIAQRIRGERAMPYMQMNEYDQSRIVSIMRRHGCGEPRIVPTNHGGIEGAIVIARKQT